MCRIWYIILVMYNRPGYFSFQLKVAKFMAYYCKETVGEDVMGSGQLEHLEEYDLRALLLSQLFDLALTFLPLCTVSTCLHHPSCLLQASMLVLLYLSLSQALPPVGFWERSHLPSSESLL